MYIDIEQYQSKTCWQAQRNASINISLCFLLCLACESNRNVQKAVFNTFYDEEMRPLLKFFGKKVTLLYSEEFNYKILNHALIASAMTNPISKPCFQEMLWSQNRAVEKRPTQNLTPKILKRKSQILHLFLHRSLKIRPCQMCSCYQENQPSCAMISGTVFDRNA